MLSFAQEAQLMAATKPLRPPGRGRPITAAEKLRRLDLTERMMRDGVSRGEMLGALAKQSGLSTRVAVGAAVNAARLRAQVLGFMAPEAVEMRASVNTHAHEAWSPEDADLTDEQIDEELAAIAEVLGLARHGREEVAFEQPNRGVPRDSRQALQP